MKKKYTLSYPDSIKLLQEEAKKKLAIDYMMGDIIEGEREQLVKAINKCLYDNAEKLGVSIYELCFRTVPEFECDGLKETITLAPVEFDLVHDGGYWKNKYYELRKKIQEVIDEKDDGHE